MRVQFHYENNSKVSLRDLNNHVKVIQLPTTVPNLPNHIQWNQESQETIRFKDDPKPRSKSKKHRRKIFEKQNFNTQITQIPTKDTISSPKLGNNISKKSVTFSNSQNQDQKIEQINKKIKNHRDLMVGLMKQRRYNPNEKNNFPNGNNLIKIEQKLAQSSVILKKQEEIIAQKIPDIEKKVENSYQAITQVKKLLKQRFESQNIKMSNLVATIEHKNTNIHAKEKQILSLSQKLQNNEYQIIKKQHDNIRYQLQLERIRRIEELQNTNLKLFSNLNHDHSPEDKFKDIDYIEEHNQQTDYWDDEESKSKITEAKLSSIRQTNRDFNQISNSTIGELLSPLTLNETILYK